MKSEAERKKMLHAYYVVAAAKKKGTLIPQPCIACGANAEAHHPDYDKPLEVIWVCKPHHRLIDSFALLKRKDDTLDLLRIK